MNTKTRQIIEHMKRGTCGTCVHYHEDELVDAFGWCDMGLSSGKPLVPYIRGMGKLRIYFEFLPCRFYITSLLFKELK